ncbi:putative E3 ubiquitin-protein ligase RING1a [Andrographis paniculata]|uniref:putative E3 ubiquitin-protein ligase RING1a n=1 Tax=Andrographis paniculata TaxID=175694 RepID=UPI0021E736E4|nr:putative E3 ubiquitin-protein ligase RING1a [Andrographis paniculata]
MPPQKRRHERTTTPPPPSPSASPSPEDREKDDESPQGSENSIPEQVEDVGDSDESSSSEEEEEEQNEYVEVNLAEIRKEFQCPICLGIIRKTRTVMECLHRFCRACIDKAMRLGNNECPACRTHCASRRSLRDDPNFDALIAVLYPDIDKFEEEELALDEEEEDLNTQIQASIAETFRRQSEAVGKKKATTKGASTSSPRSPANNRTTRRGRNTRRPERDESDAEDAAIEESSDDEGRRRAKKYKRRRKADEGSSKRGQEQSNPPSIQPIRTQKILFWGRLGLRKKNRRPGREWRDCSKHCRIFDQRDLCDRMQKARNRPEPEIDVVVVPLNGQSLRKIRRPYLHCSRTAKVKDVCKFISFKSSMPDASLMEMLMIRDVPNVKPSIIFEKESSVMSPSLSKLVVLDEDQTLEEISSKFNQPNLVLAYRYKVPSMFWFGYEPLRALIPLFG